MKLIQITDLHLLKNPDDVFCDIYPDQHLQALLPKVKLLQPDGVILSGDLSQDTSPESYQRLAGYCQSLECPVYFIPGNHDDVALCITILQKAGLIYQKQVDLGAWQLVFLDSVVPGKTPGHLKQAEFDFLLEAMQAAKPTFVCMHHHPVPVSQFMDRYIIDNFEAFLQVVKPLVDVKLVAFGHIHAELFQKIEHIHFLGAPASSVQFSVTATSKDNGIDPKPPGFRVFELNGDGGFVTWVVRL